MSHKYSLGDIVFKVRLTVRLLMDKRIAFYLKLIPIAALVYLVVPFDLIIGPIDVPCSSSVRYSYSSRYALLRLWTNTPVFYETAKKQILLNRSNC